jgi:hypothetical protein
LGHRIVTGHLVNNNLGAEVEVQSRCRGQLHRSCKNAEMQRFRGAEMVQCRRRGSVDVLTRFRRSVVQLIMVQVHMSRYKGAEVLGGAEVLSC